MSNILAAVAYPQIKMLPPRIMAHNSNYDQLMELVGQKLSEAFCANGNDFEQLPPRELIAFIPQLPGVEPVFDSLQLRIKSISADALNGMIKSMNMDGFKVQLFATPDNARYYKSWQYCVAEGDHFEQTEKHLEGVIDMRLLAHDTADDVEKQATAIVSHFLTARGKDLEGAATEDLKGGAHMVFKVANDAIPVTLNPSVYGM